MCSHQESRYPTQADIQLAMSFTGHMMIELIPATDGMDELFTKFWRASVDWEGKDPVRPFG